MFRVTAVIEADSQLLAEVIQVSIKSVVGMAGATVISVEVEEVEE